MGGDANKQITLPDFAGPRPDFGNPPVSEVVLALQFDRLDGFGVTHMGLLWDRFRRRYPHTSTKVPLSDTREGFGTPQPPIIKFSLGEEPEVPRCWFENATGTELIQVQPDKFIFNWRQISGGETYPRYEKVRVAFSRHLNTFVRFLRDYDLGKVVPNQCEVTYVNNILPGGGWSRPSQVARVISTWSGRHSDTFLLEPENVNFNLSYRMLSREKEPLGRLHIILEPRVRRDDGSPLLRLVLTARGAPLKQTRKAAMEFFDLGREYVVRGFASITSPRMHGIWERKDA